MEFMSFQSPNDRSISGKDGCVGVIENLKRAFVVNFVSEKNGTMYDALGLLGGFLSSAV